MKTTKSFDSGQLAKSEKWKERKDDMDINEDQLNKCKEKNSPWWWSEKNGTGNRKEVKIKATFIIQIKYDKGK